MKYPLQFLVKIRRDHQQRCEQALVQARAARERREEELALRQKELRDYRDWCDREEDRLFDVIFRGASTNKDVVSAKEEMLWNRQKESEYTGRVAEAEKALTAAIAEVQARIEALQRATKNIEKLSAHRDLWTAEARLFAQQAEDMQMEEAAEIAFSRRTPDL